MVSPHVTALYAGLFGLGQIVLAVLVIRQRHRTRQVLGDGGDLALQRAIRVHGNFCEYVPMALVLLLAGELILLPAWLLHLSGGALLVGRLSHAIGVGGREASMLPRSAGMALTFGPIGVLAVALLLRVLAGV